MKRTSTKSGLLAVTLLLVTGTLVASEAELDNPPRLSLEDVRRWVDRAPKNHPRLLATGAELEALRRVVAEDPLPRLLADAVIAQAQTMHDLPPITPTQTGRRLLGQSRRGVKRVVMLATAYHLTGDARHARRAEKEMLAAARFSDWNPTHFLDVAEMTLALAIGYDWLYDQLDEATRAALRTAIIRKGVALQFESDHTGWVQSTHNWGQVCHGGLTAGALAVMS